MLRNAVGVAVVALLWSVVVAIGVDGQQVVRPEFSIPPAFPALPTGDSADLWSGLDGAHDPNTRKIAAADLLGGAGEILVLGARFARVVDSQIGLNATCGVAHVFTRPSSTSPWTREAILRPSNCASGQEFGNAVAVDGNSAGGVVRIAIGAMFEATCGGADLPNSTSCPGSGAAYTFVIQPGDTNPLGSRGWVEEVRLKQAVYPGDLAMIDDRFGWSVDLSGDTLVVGAFYEDNCARGVNSPERNFSCSQSGAVFSYRIPTVRLGSFAFDSYIKQSNTVAEGTENFGGSLALDGNTLVVGADDESSSHPLLSKILDGFLRH